MTLQEQMKRLRSGEANIVNNELLLELAVKQTVNAFRHLRRHERMKLAELSFVDRALHALVEYYDKVERDREESATSSRSTKTLKDK